MQNVLTKKVLPLFLTLLVLFSVTPLGVAAANITMEPTIEITENGGTPPDVSVSSEPNGEDNQPPESVDPGEVKTPATSQPEPDSGGTESTPPVDNSSTPPSEDESAVSDEESTDEADVPPDPEADGIMRSTMGVMNMSGHLTIHRVEAHQWNFNKDGGGGVDMRPWYMMDIGGVPAYCVEPTNPDTTSGMYTQMSWDGLSTSQQYAIGYILLYGAQDLGNPLYHMATQVIIWEITYGYMDLTSFTTVNKSTYNATIGYNPGAAGYYEDILAKVRSHMEVPSFAMFYQAAAPTHKLSGISGEYKVSLQNTNPNVNLGDFNFTNTGSVSFVRDKQTLHVTSTEPLYADQIYAGFKGATTQTNSLIYWCKGDEQVRATAGFLDPVPAYFRLTTEDVGEYSITVRKLQKGTNTPLQGASFQVRHAEKGVIGNFTTDGSGVLKVNVPWQGTYIITEVNPPAGHKLDENNVKDVVVSTDNPHVEVSFHNAPYSGIEITKVDGTSGARIAGVTFRVALRDGGTYTDVVTAANGVARIEDLEPDWYTITEIDCPPGYILDPTPHVVEVKSGVVAEIRLLNYKKPTLEITKIDADTGAKLPGAVFRIAYKGSGDYVDITSGADGIARLTGMQADYYIVTEIRAPEGYLLNDQPQTVEMIAGEINRITITNSKKPGIYIVKEDSDTGERLAGATFRVARRGSAESVDIVSGADGIARLTGMEPDYYIVTEIIAPNGYLLNDTPQTIEIVPGKITTLTMKNQRKPSLEIVKLDSITKQPLQYATFELNYKNGAPIGRFTSDADGRIYLEGLNPGIVVIEEISAPDGYLANEDKIEVTLEAGKSHSIELLNTPKSPIIIKKVDSLTGEPLAGAKFRITKMNGEFVGEYTSGRNGFVTVPELEPGWYIVVELIAPDGYKLNNTPVNVQLKMGTPAIVEMENTPLPGLQIKKIDAVTKQPLGGVTIRVTKMNGEMVGDYVTNSSGLIVCPELEPGWYTAYETATVEGYILDTTPQNVELKAGKTAVLEFSNKPLAGLSILKLDSVTGEGLAGIEFEVRKINGELVGNFTSGDGGRIFIPELLEGYYIIRETKTLPGYKIDTAEQMVEVKSGVQNTVTFKNHPYPYLVICKIDSETNKPIPGVKFRVFSDNGNEIGTYTTNAAGRIVLTGLDAGRYQVQEVEAAPGYQLDSRVWDITLEYGKTTTITFKNEKLASLRLIKVCAETGERLYGVSFLLYDMKNNIIGEFTTDQNGEIILHEELQPGKYKLKEIKAAPGYLIDDTIHTIEVKSGHTTEVVLKNIPERGVIQIIKIAAEDNKLTGQLAGVVLEGAVFEIYNSKLEVVDRITTDSRGLATSKELPLETYTIKEVESPEYWLINEKEFTAEVKVHGDLIRFVVEDNAPDISTTVEKRGVVEALAGESIRYDFRKISNTSNVPLEDFYWRDLLPTDAVRLETIHTGTWNERLNYRVVYKTNLKDSYVVLAEDLLSTVNHRLDCSPRALGLASNEYVTEFKFEFGTVKPGFKEDKAPFIFVRVLADLPNEYQFTNRTDVGGRYGDKWTYDKDAWTTVVFKFEQRGKLPKTGVWIDEQ